jgi:beta-phosphoglucomutase-like phosphatase (HAD superfamily)
MMDWMPQAVVFDCDGLLVESESCWTVAETALFTRHGLEFGSRAEGEPDRQVPSRGRADNGRHVRQAGSTAEVEVELVSLVLEALEEVRPMPGAADLVKRVQDMPRLRWPATRHDCYSMPH